MEKAILTKNGNGGRYVAVQLKEGGPVVATGHDPKDVYAKAKESGAEKPVVFFVPKEDKIHIH